MIRKIIYFLMSVMISIHSEEINSISLKTCSQNLPIPVLGILKTIKYSSLFFGQNKTSVSSEQRKCILSGKKKVSQIIRQCSRDLTINPETIPFKVAQGMGLNSENQWVSACAPEMPCIIFNEYFANGTVGQLMDECGAKEQWELIKNNKYFWKTSFSGFTQCQKYQPSLCIYPEKVNNSNQTVMYACPVSEDIYTANFLLLYIVSPYMASRLPGCRLKYPE